MDLQAEKAAAEERVTELEELPAGLTVVKGNATAEQAALEAAYTQVNSLVDDPPPTWNLLIAGFVTAGEERRDVQGGDRAAGDDQVAAPSARRAQPPPRTSAESPPADYNQPHAFGIQRAGPAEGFRVSSKPVFASEYIALTDVCPTQCEPGRAQAGREAVATKQPDPTRARQHHRQR